MKTAVVLFTRDLPMRDNAALAAACEQADLVVPLFAVDATLMAAAPNRPRFLLESLADLREGLRARGGRSVRSGITRAVVWVIADGYPVRPQWSRSVRNGSPHPACAAPAHRAGSANVTSTGYVKDSICIQRSCPARTCNVRQVR